MGTRGKSTERSTRDKPVKRSRCQSRAPRGNNDVPRESRETKRGRSTERSTRKTAETEPTGGAVARESANEPKKAKRRENSRESKERERASCRMERRPKKYYE